MWSKYTGVLIWKTQNPWTGLRGQFYDHLHDQTAGFYGCRSAAEPVHVQLNLATYFIEVKDHTRTVLFPGHWSTCLIEIFNCIIISYSVTHDTIHFLLPEYLSDFSSFSCHEQAVNTLSEQLSDVAIEASVWDLEGTCPYYVVHEKLSVPSKKTVPILEMKYPKSKNPKPVYFLLLKLYKMSDYGVISRNFYWLHLPGGDYKLLEPYRKKRVPLKITSNTFIKGSTYEMEIHVENKSKKPDSKSLTSKNNFVTRIGDGDFDMASLGPVNSAAGKKQEASLFQRIYRRFSGENDDDLQVFEINGSDEGVAFSLYFSVHASEPGHKEGEDSRILPVHYSDNYFSLVPGEVMPIKISFEVPPGVTPRIRLHGWNYHSGHKVC